MLGKEELYKRINEFYLKAKHYLDTDNTTMAFKILYEEMPLDLYDISINLWADRNAEQDVTRKNLISLIEEVDLKLNPPEDDNITD